MPPTEASSYPGLKIELENPLKAYLPGETITGLVTYKPVLSSQVTNIQTVRLIASGRTKTKIVHHNGQNRSVYRGRRTLFQYSQTIVPDLGESALGSDGQWAWPFACPLPVQPQPGNLKGDEYARSGGYLGTADIPNHTLPASYMHLDDDSFSSRSQAYIEYRLCAEIVEKEKSYKSHTTILPITIRSPSTSTPITDFKIKTNRTPVILKTTRFLPPEEQPDGKREKMKLFFKSTPTPTYAFSVIIDRPQVLQINHPSPIPFYITILHTSSTKTQTTLDPSQPLPRIRLKEVQVQLKSLMECRAPGLFGERNEDASFKIDLIRKAFIADTWMTDKRVQIPVLDESEYILACKGSTSKTLNLAMFLPTRTTFTPTTTGATNSVSTSTAESGPSNHEINPEDIDASTAAPPPTYEEATLTSGPIDYAPSSSSSQPPPSSPSISDSPLNNSTTTTNDSNNNSETPQYLNIGKLLNAHLSNKNNRQKIYESFESYNIIQSWMLKWKIVVECEGETEKIEGQGGVCILPASD